MIYLLYCLLAIVIGALIYLGSLSGTYSVRRQLLINTDIDSAFNKVCDLNSWSDWSPWLMHEPETKLTYSDQCDQEGGSYQWQGQYIGVGKLTHVKFDRPHRIEQRLEFTKPFKAVCQVGFEFVEQDGQTEVTWFMQGKMPFLFRFMTEKTKDMLSKDYDLGLAMLAGQLDAKAEYPQLQFHGKTTFEPKQALCLAFNGELEAMMNTMETGFPELMAHLEQQKIQCTGAPFTAYHKVDCKKMHFVCDMAVPVAAELDTGKFSLKTLGGGNYYKVTLKGRYDFLELGWYAAIAHVQMLKLKYDESRDSFEVYENDPTEVADSNAIETSIYVPIK